MLTLWRNASIATCDEQGRVFEHGALVTEDARIAWLGDERDLPAGLRVERTIELARRWVTPGLVDCHTHVVFAGQRAAEFARRTAGTSYAEIAREGGGILSTVRATRDASVDELVMQSEPRVRSLLQEGVTTLEIKSGYGLEYEAERRMLLAARALEAKLPVRVVTSLLAAHAVPPEFAGRADEYVDLIVADWLPRFAGETGLVDVVDAYCESIAFSATQCDRLFQAATARGWPVRLHSDQISNIGGSRVAARHRALACDHLEYATEGDVAELARAGTVAVLLPVAYYVLGDPRLPPIAPLRTHGVPIAIASDANPGSAPGASLLVAMNMGRRLFGMTSDEVLHGATRHAARALGLQRRCGTLAPGLDADLAVWAIDTLDELGYWIGYNPCSMVVRGGEIVLERDV
ncbi:MAG TPA: imidazolonepropionase [Steroidobacteraceae bacterium]|nr:imidazolonepropionase [Steroidobacteraceae bacterium]